MVGHTIFTSGQCLQRLLRIYDGSLVSTSLLSADDGKQGCQLQVATIISNSMLLVKRSKTHLSCERHH